MCESGACPRGRRALRIVRHTVGLITFYYDAVYASFTEKIMKKIFRAVCRPAEPFYLSSVKVVRGGSHDAFDMNFFFPLTFPRVRCVLRYVYSHDD